MKELLSFEDNTITKEMNEDILKVLLDGKAYTAIEISNLSKITLANVLYQIEDLVSQGWIELESDRRPYYKVAGSRKLGELRKYFNYNSNGTSEDQTLPPIKYCRSCYGHLAGRVGRKLTQQMIEKKLLVKPEDQSSREFIVTDKGEAFFQNLDIEVSDLDGKTRYLAKACLDFSERKHHLGGSLGKAFLNKLFEKGWMRREEPGTREVTPTPEGKKALHELLGINL